MTVKISIGRLIWIDSKTGKDYFILRGPFALLNSRKKLLKQDPLYSGGKFKITY